MGYVLIEEKDPLISIVVPVYKVEMFLTRCIESVLHQTYTNWELILVDDGSPDRCGDMCDAYARRDARIFVVHQKNKGVSEARNNGIKNCHGKYLYFLDSDDYIAPETFTVLLRYALQEKAEIVMHGHYQVMSDGRVQSAVDWKPSANADKIRKDILSDKIPNFVWGKLFLRCLWDGVEFPPGQTMEDMFVMPRIFLKARKIMLVTDLLYYYCQHSGSLMNSAHLSSYIRARYGRFLAWKEHEAVAQEYYPALEGICRRRAVHSAVRSLFLNSGVGILSSQIQHEIQTYLFSQKGSLPFGLQCNRILILYGPQKLNCLLGKMQRAIVAYQQKKRQQKGK